MTDEQKSLLIAVAVALEERATKDWDSHADAEHDWECPKRPGRWNAGACTCDARGYMGRCPKHDDCECETTRTPEKRTIYRTVANDLRSVAADRRRSADGKQESSLIVRWP